MAGGSWGNYIADSGETVFVPVSFDPFCLEQLGYIDPVSYPPLDVYKRQVRSILSACIMPPSRVTPNVEALSTGASANRTPTRPSCGSGLSLIHI